MNPLKPLGNKIKGAIKAKIIGILVAIVGLSLALMLAIGTTLYVVGAAQDFIDNIKNFFVNAWGSLFGDSDGDGDSVPDIDNMTAVEFEEWVNDAENLYAVYDSGSFQLTAFDQMMIDNATVKSIFTSIHDYNNKRKNTTDLTYTYRIETQSKLKDKKYEDLHRGTSSDGMTETIYTIDSDSKSRPKGISYSKKRTVSVNRASAEVEAADGDAAVDLFKLRWQPIFAACAVVAQDLGEQWGENSSVDFSKDSLEDIDVTNYYLTDEQINYIIDLFYFDADYLFDPITERVSFSNTYKFKDMASKKCAFTTKLQFTDTTRISERIPAFAPNVIYNGYEKFIYHYKDYCDESGNVLFKQCDSITYELNGYEIITYLQEIDPEFDYDTFLEILDELPASDDLYERYNQDEFKLDGDYTYTHEYYEGGAIGVYFISSDSSGDSGDGGNTEQSTSETTVPIPYYDYDGLTDDLRYLVLYADEEADKDYGLYEVNKYAFMPMNYSLNLTQEQILYVLDNWTFVQLDASTWELFDSEDAREKTAEVLYTFQNESNANILFYISLFKSMNKYIGGGTLRYYYNYFQIEATEADYTIEGTIYEDCKSKYGDDAWECLKNELAFFQTNIVGAGQLNYFLLGWYGYDGKSYDTITKSYNYPYFDLSMPWTDESHWVMQGQSIQHNITGGIGWTNTCTQYYVDVANLAYGWANNNGVPFEGLTFNTDSLSGELMGDALYEFWSKEIQSEYFSAIGHPEIALPLMANWYVDHIYTYQKTEYPEKASANALSNNMGYTISGVCGYYDCPLIENSVRDDCSGFACAYASLVAGTYISATDTATMAAGYSGFTDNGFVKLSTEDINVADLQIGDILIFSGKSNGKAYGHAEVFVDTNKSFGWGAVHNSYPSSSNAWIDAEDHTQILHGTKSYTVVYRYVGNQE